MPQASSANAPDFFNSLLDLIQSQRSASRVTDYDKIDKEARAMQSMIYEHLRHLTERVDDLSAIIRNDHSAAIRNIQIYLGLTNLVVGQAPKELQRRILTLARFLNPQHAVGVTKARFGRARDGGYVMLDDLPPGTTALSLGIALDDSWDRAVADRNIIVYQFDHTVAGPPTEHPNYRFLSRRIVAPPSDEGETLGALIEATGDKGAARLVLKMDIEGDEWAILEAVTASHLKQISQIVCEFHGFGLVGADDQYKRMKVVLEKIDREFAVIHVHSNWTGWQQAGGVPFPNILEVTYASRAQYVFEESAELFPTTLDYPNDPAQPDLYLGSFKWPSE